MLITLLTVLVSASLAAMIHDDQAVDKAGGAKRAVMQHPTLDALIVCDEPDHDFGTVWAGPLLQYSFEVRNEGAETAWVRIIHSGSMGGCTFEAAPGARVFLPINLDSTKLRGTFAKRITLSLVDPREPTSCAECGSWVGGQQHLAACLGGVGYAADTCVRYKSPN